MALAGARPGIERSCSFSAFAKPILCVFRRGGRGGKGSGPGGLCCTRAGLGHSRAWDTPRVMSPALWHQHPALLEVLCTPRSWCVPWEGSVHPKISVNPLRVLLVHPELSGHPPGGFSAPQDFGASPQGVPVHPKVLVPPRGRFCAPQDLGAPPGWFLCPPSPGSFAGCPSRDCSLYLWCDICNIVYFSYVS